MQIDDNSRRYTGSLQQNPSVHSLIEIDAPPDWRSPSSGKFGTRCETKVPYLGHNLVEPWRGDNIVVHEDQVFFLPIEFVDFPDHRSDRCNVALAALRVSGLRKSCTSECSRRDA